MAVFINKQLFVLYDVECKTCIFTFILHMHHVWTGEADKQDGRKKQKDVFSVGNICEFDNSWDL